MQIEECTGTFTLEIPRHHSGSRIKAMAADIVRDLPEILDGGSIIPLYTAQEEAFSNWKTVHG
jgi:hypothetical protein